ncbi:hypothetical protein FPHYL_2195 [Fusarium phyllophilum]|uniref:Uncharacterized protein n=1 Tax=Fusarium phyllophilum TaxID=47803 RepID=A0A8H5NME2_9HYPO|nr:hypothetical protein FPHYL_2195 [Fusarium phyllophilum]
MPSGSAKLQIRVEAKSCYTLSLILALDHITMSISAAYGIRVSRFAIPSHLSFGLGVARDILMRCSDLHEVNGMHVAHNSDKNLVLTPTDVGGLGFSLQYNGNETALVVKDDSVSDLLSVIGPSGRGPHKLRTSPETRPFGLGSMIYRGFSMKGLSDETGDHTLEIADENINDGHWMAWRDPEGNGDWSIYWVTPRPYNMDDLSGGVHIELILDNEA